METSNQDDRMDVDQGRPCKHVDGMKCSPACLVAAIETENWTEVDRLMSSEKLSCSKESVSPYKQYLWEIAYETLYTEPVTSSSTKRKWYD